MRLLADENFPGEAVTRLMASGHDVFWVRTAASGTSDAEIVAWAHREQRIILTFDKDFGELAWRAGLPMASGVVLFRVPMPPATEIGTALAARVGERTDWARAISPS
jgi:predicted nuclease of predicted toxin-antitoxin system